MLLTGNITAPDRRTRLPATGRRLPPESTQGITVTSELFTLSEDHRDVREAIREIADNEIAPFAADVDEHERYPVEAQKALVGGGFPSGAHSGGV